MTLEDCPDIMKIDDLAALLRISRGAAYEAVKQGVVPSFRVGKVIRISKKSLSGLLLRSS